MTDEHPLTDEELELLLSNDAPTYCPPGKGPRDRDAIEVNLFDYEQGLCVFGCGGHAVGQGPTGHQPGCLLLRLVADLRSLRASRPLTYACQGNGDPPKGCGKPIVSRHLRCQDCLCAQRDDAQREADQLRAEVERLNAALQREARP